MRVYQFTVPAEKRSAVFDTALAFQFGGYTVARGEGAWVDGSGKLVSEKVLVYSVATEKECTLRATVAQFLREEGEQALYFAEVGTAEVASL